MGWITQNALAIDQLGNTLLGGYADETLSSHAWRSRRHKYWRWCYRFINWIFFWQKDHCLKAFETEVARGHLPLIMRNSYQEKE